MKKVLKINRLYCFLPLLLLVIFSPIDISTMKLKVAFSSPVNFVNKIKPVQRPGNLLNYQESVNTILNLVKQKLYISITMSVTQHQPFIFLLLRKQMY